MLSWFPVTCLVDRVAAGYCVNLPRDPHAVKLLGLKLGLAFPPLAAIQSETPYSPQVWPVWASMEVSTTLGRLLLVGFQILDAQNQVTGFSPHF